MEQAELGRGPYDEIIAPPLVGGLDEKEALQLLIAEARQRGDRTDRVPTRGRSLKGMYELALVCAHNRNLRAALQGEMDDDPDAALVRQLVVEDGEALSLRPLGQEGLVFLTFAPILRRIEADRWRVGLPERGRSAVVEGEPGAALERAWALRLQWTAEEKEQFGANLEKALDRVPYSLNHTYWAHLLRQDEIAIVAAPPGQDGPALGVERMGKHQTYRLHLMKGQRIFDAGSPERACRIAEAVALQVKMEVLYPAPGAVLPALLAQREAAGRVAQRPQQDGSGAWTVGDVRARWEGAGNRLAVLGQGERRYALLRNGDQAGLYPVQGQRVDRKALAVTALAPNLAQALTEADGRALLLLWAVARIEDKGD